MLDKDLETLLLATTTLKSLLYRNMSLKEMLEQMPKQFADFINDNLKNLSTNDQLFEKIQQLETYFKGLDELQIVIAKEPQQEFLEEIKKRLNNFTKGVVYLKIKIDERLFAGCQIYYQGRFFDGSLPSLINKYVA